MKDIQNVPAADWPNRLVQDLKNLREHVKDGNELWCEQVEDSVRQLAEEVFRLRQEAEGKEAGGRQINLTAPQDKKTIS